MGLFNACFASISSTRQRLFGLFLLLPALCLLALPADAQWQWRDKDGRMNISDRPPPKDVPDKDILKRPGSVVVRQGPSAAAPGAISTTAEGAESAAVAATPAATPASPATAASAPMSSLQREVQARKAAEAQALAAKAKADEERIATQRASNCKNARGHAANLEGGMRIARTNEAGERVVLDDQARAAELLKAREIMASDCR